MIDVSAARPANEPLRTMELIRDRTVEAVLGQSGISHQGLATEIRRQLGATAVADGALVREPIIEGAAPFKVDGRTFADCAGDLLHPDVIRAISSNSAGDYRFPPEAQPYRHQIEAWRHLTASECNSVVVSSGTGSGKTECFLMPLLDDLARDAESAGRLSGVRALALYPLNALIASQEERLKAWTAPFADRIRFGLYNGLTPETLRAQDRPGPEQVGDRTTLRSDPPPILVTNVTMLEYMLIRRIDRPLIENSRGKLRWIVLDEAHSYVGSAAAEIALLLRRVLLTFGVSAEDVRFVATSATIGGEGADVTDELRRFLRDISGASEERVRVVIGEREGVLLPPPAATSVLDEISLQDRDRLAAAPAVQSFVREAQAGATSVQRARQVLAAVEQPLENVLAAIAADADKQRGPLLPLRVHGFLRAVPGLWSCLNPGCSQAPLNWQFGALSMERVDRCPHCTSPVLEIMSCRECGEPYLDGEEREGRIQARYTPPTLDEFAALREREFADADDAEPHSPDASYDARRLALAVRSLPGCGTAHIEPASGQRCDRAQDETIPVPIHAPDGCAACGADDGALGAALRPMRFGAPFLIGNAAPVLLEGVAPRDVDTPGAYRPPAEGRQLISFTDSRQGTARFAANLQTNAERGFVRGYIYHAVQGSTAASGEDDPSVKALREEIAALEPGVAQFGAAAPSLVALLDDKRSTLAAKLAPNTTGIAWPELRKHLAAQPEVHHWMVAVWGPREDRYRKKPADFAEFLLLREFNRRPRRGNTVETLGLARLRFDAVDNAVNLPDALRARGFGVPDWRGLLYSVIDMSVRGQFAIRADWNDLHWLHSQKPLAMLLPPGERSEARREIPWPRAGTRAGLPSNLVMILERTLGLDRMEAQDRRDLNEVLDAAWQALRPVLYSPDQPGYALDFAKARIAPVTEAWRCPVTRRVLPATALGLTQYGHREGLVTAADAPAPLKFPQLPNPFPRGNQIEAIRDWLVSDPKIAALRDEAVWANLHDRVALLSPYARAAEHSAQQPPARLRRFEREFKAGEINILNCSTTMEMGVDIGSVSAVMMTNVPPSLANFRQRVGRAGRRRQGFASSLTYTRDTPLDREAFRDPLQYLSRTTRAPRVKLDSRRIVQRHVNALLLARWFAEAGGEALKTRAGDFFGCPAGVGTPQPDTAPVEAASAWVRAPSTQAGMAREVARLVAGTILHGDRGLLEETARALELTSAALREEWAMLQAQAASINREEGRASIEYQIKRLAQENLLKELAVRGILPAHGLPTAVVPFVHDDKPSAEDVSGEDDGSRRRRSFPSRTLDIAIRDYAPGAEVVVDGLVFHSAGVTLNWQRPVDDAQAREVQAISVFWTCPSCGAADCVSAAPEHCPGCGEDLPFEAQRRFLEPAGFTVDMGEKPHADTDEVSYVEPEAEQIVARQAAWEPMADPQQGRYRASADGLVFYSSRGPGGCGYHICLECGRAEAAGGAGAAATKPLQDHRPLRGTRRNPDGLCPGNDKSFKITAPIALGYQAITDVAELQPTGLESEGAAWAAVSALREALARHLGVEAGELGLAVRPARTLLGQRTHSLFLYDRASGGAGFAPQAIAEYPAILKETRDILDCQEPGCTRACSSCVLTSDLYRQQETLDRKTALAWAEAACTALGQLAEADRIAPEARYSRSLADEVVMAVLRGATSVTVWAGGETDVAGLTGGPFAAAARRIVGLGGRLRLAIPTALLERLDPAARLALRDAAKMLEIDLRKGDAPTWPNGAHTLAVSEGTQPTVWASRDEGAATIGIAWGVGQTAPVVRATSAKAPLSIAVDPDSLLPPSGTKFIELTDQLDGDLAGFGSRFAHLIAPAIRSAGASDKLRSIEYNDRYLQSPLTVRLLVECLAALRDAFGSEVSVLPVNIFTNPLRPNERQPFAPDHDWQFGEDRAAVLSNLLSGANLELKLQEQGSAHGRIMTLRFTDDQVVRVILDQGMGPWRTPRFARFEFGIAVDRQGANLRAFNSLISIRGSSYAVVTN